MQQGADLDMSPDLSASHLGNQTLGHSVLNRKIGAPGSRRTDRDNDVLSELCAAMRRSYMSLRSPILPTLGGTILEVIPLSSKEEMSNVTTDSVIASVEDKELASLSIGKEPSDSVTPYSIAFSPQSPVSRTVHFPSPRPARIGATTSINMVPQSVRH